MPSKPSHTRLSRLSGFLALQRSTAGVLAMVVLVGLGERLSERFLPVYIMALGGGAIAIGLLNAMDNLLSALYSFPGGYLSDRLGAKRALLIFNLISMAGYAVVILIPTWQAVLAGAALFISWSSISLPATISLMYEVLPPDKRTMGVTLHSLVNRLPMALGPLLGGVMISVWGEKNGVRLAMGLALALAALALVLQQSLIEDRRARPHSGKSAGLLSPEKNPVKLWRQMDPDMRGLLATDILVRFCEQIPYAFVVVWCMKVISQPVSAVQFGLLTSIEMATAILVYIPVAHLADKSTKKPFVVITFGFFTLFPLVLMFSQSFGWLVLAFIIRGLKEFGEPTRKSLIMDLAPDHCKAGMFGLYYLVRDVVVSLAALGGAFLWEISPVTNFLAAFGFGVIGTLGYALFGRDVRLAPNPAESP
jgi:MFS family permease